MRKLEDIVIYQDEGYNTFPSIATARGGDLLVAFRHAPDRRATHGGLVTHGDPEAVIRLVRSRDGGRTWGEARQVYGRYGISAQDPCLTALADGTLLLTTFFWKFYPASEKALLERTLLTTFGVIDMFDDRVMVFHGSHAFLSRDGGETFEGPHGIDMSYAVRGQCVQLPDGTILAPLYGAGGRHGHRASVVVFASRDGGSTWDPYAFVSEGLGAGRRCDEPTLFRTASGRLFCFIRTDDGMYYCTSDDDGRTWGAAVATELPAHVPYNALQLPSGNVFLSYGHRAAPYGVRGMLLDGECGGIDRAQEIVLRDDALGSDISYNHAAVLPNGDILAIYYFHNEAFDQRRHIAGTIVRESEAPDGAST